MDRSSGEIEHEAHGRNDALELLALGGELLSSGGGQGVVPRAAIVVRRSPFGLDVAVEGQTLERGVQGALADLKHVARQLTDALGDAVSVVGAADEGPKDEKVERSGEEFGWARSCHRRASIDGRWKVGSGRRGCQAPSIGDGRRALPAAPRLRTDLRAL